jgi:twitching motility protein PilT
MAIPDDDTLRGSGLALGSGSEVPTLLTDTDEAYKRNFIRAVQKAVLEDKASDVHIKSGDQVRARVNGELVPVSRAPVPSEDVARIVALILPAVQSRRITSLDQITDLDFSWGLDGVGRFRVNVLRQRGTFMIVMRTIKTDVPSLTQLGLPAVVADIALLESGLVLVSGPTGSGKSTTLASMLDHINQTRAAHIVTLEDPIEFIHRNQRASITQREVGADTDTFYTGLKYAVRQDPDVILVAELRDEATIETALAAAETGHLVLASVHAWDAAGAVQRIVSAFAPGDAVNVRSRLAESLRAVVSQQLIAHTRAGRARVLTAEVMVVTPQLRDAIRNDASASALYDMIAAGRDSYQSQTFDQHLSDLLAAGTVSFAVARGAATRPSDFDRLRNLGSR